MNSKNIFSIVKENDVFVLYFTTEFIDSIGCIWAFVPQETKKLTIGKLFANIESSRKLVPLKSPVSGTIVSWNSKFLEYPDKIVSSEFLLRASQ